ncbi:hypothetical protein CFP56_016501 [Quercus suber]|uniref:Uncharacterized protein n=1 Tax=Quercus suber TaxID=58331 RepID=A0AAW0M2G1_QUESU
MDPQPSSSITDSNASRSLIFCQILYLQLSITVKLF